jgi:hypothetical protein
VQLLLQRQVHPPRAASSPFASSAPDKHNPILQAATHAQLAAVGDILSQVLRAAAQCQ